MLNADENEVVMRETGQRTKMEELFLRRLQRLGFSAQREVSLPVNANGKRKGKICT